jgi:two-component system, NarL family, nitrate/nitrite response regulator NarL
VVSKATGLDHLLIVDDQILFATSVASLLRTVGQEVETISGPSVEAVIDMVDRLAPVLVLLDLMLGPLGSGLDLIQPIKAAGGRVVMMTGEQDPALLGACIEAGALGVVSKMTGLGELVEAVRRAINDELVMGYHQRQVLLDAVHVARESNRRRNAPFSLLSSREQAVLVRLMAGESAETIAATNYVSIATVRAQIQSILKKLGVTSQLGAVAIAHDAAWRPFSAG